MHLAVDDAGQNVQAGAVDDVARLAGIEVADGNDLAVGDADIAQTLAVMIDDGAALKNSVERILRHGLAPFAATSISLATRTEGRLLPTHLNIG